MNIPGIKVDNTQLQKDVTDLQAMAANLANRVAIIERALTATMADVQNIGQAVQQLYQAIMAPAQPVQPEPVSNGGPDHAQLPEQGGQADQQGRMEPAHP